MAEHITKPLQGIAYQNFRCEILGIPEDTPDTDLDWYRPKNTFIPFPWNYAERSDIKIDKRNNESR